MEKSKMAQNHPAQGQTPGPQDEARRDEETSERRQTEPKQPEEDEEEIPDWLDKTPEETEYSLEMSAGGGSMDLLQHIYLDRDEFIRLKEYLAEIRGYRKAAA